MSPGDRRLLEQFRPLLRYDSNEFYYADSARGFVENHYTGGPAAAYRNALCNKDGDLIAAAGDDQPEATRLRLELLGHEGSEYSAGHAVSSDDYLDAACNKAYVADARRAHEIKGFGNVIYGAVRPGADDKRWLQYWFFFYCNDKEVHGFGVHEGDWEGIQIRVGPPDQNGRVNAEEVTYAQHDGGERADWGEVEIDEKTGAPVVYVGLGSHASYLRSGSHNAPIVPDVCDGEGAQIWPEIEFIDEERDTWVRWPGRWGASKKRGLISFPSPESPGQQHRWDHADDFHGKARRFDERRGVEAEEIAPPPTVVARREGDTIYVELTAQPETAAKLVVPAVVDGVPQGLEYDLSELSEGDGVALNPVGDGPTVAAPAEDDRR